MTRRALRALLPLTVAACWLVAGPAAADRPSGSHAPAGPAGLAAPSPHAAAGHGKDAHGEDHGPGHINWFHGFLAEKDDIQEGDLLYRPKGTPPPLGAMLLNTAILFYVIVRFSRRPLSDALKKRKASIIHGIEEATKMKDQAGDRLSEYEDKLEHLDDEIERLKREMREAGETERARILAEAKERRARMERDARLLIEQELKAARQELVGEAVRGAMSSAAAQIAKELSAADQQRIADEYLASLDAAVVNARGGDA